MKNKKYSRGLISTIVLIVVALIILGYYNINVETVVSSPMVRENLAYAWGAVVDGLKMGWDWIISWLPKTSS